MNASNSGRNLRTIVFTGQPAPSARPQIVVPGMMPMRSPTSAGVVRVLGHAQRLEPVGPALEDVLDAGQRLDVVDDGRLAEGALDGREGRLDPRPGPLALQRLDQPRLLAADVRPGAAVGVDVE